MPSHLVDITMFWSRQGGGGVARYLRSKRRWLEAQSLWRQTIVTPGQSDAESVGIPAPMIPFSGGYRFPLSRTRAAQTLAALAPDLIEAGDPYRFAWGALDAGQRCGVPTLAFVHSNLELLASRYGSRVARAGASRYMRHLYSQFDTVLAPSAWMANRLRDLGLENVTRQPLGVDCKIFTPAMRDEKWRASMGLSANQRVLIYAGRFSPEKNLQTLVDAVDLLDSRYVLFAIGAGPVPPSGSRVRVLSFQPDSSALAKVLANADAFVHAGDQETFGLAALEAMACGTPVVAAGVAGLAELVDETVGIGVRGATARDFADGITTLFARDREVISAAARERALEYDWSTCFAQLFGIYARLIAAPQSSIAKLVRPGYA